MPEELFQPGNEDFEIKALIEQPPDAEMGDLPCPASVFQETGALQSKLRGTENLRS